jgi:hypothetical protein
MRLLLLLLLSLELLLLSLELQRLGRQRRARSIPALIRCPHPEAVNTDLGVNESRPPS